MPLSAKRCISGLKSSVSLRHLLDRVLPLDLVRPVVPFRGQCGVRGAQPFVPWCHVVLPLFAGASVRRGRPGTRRVSVAARSCSGFSQGVGAAVVSVVGFWLGEGVVGVVWSPRVIVVSGMRAPPEVAAALLVRGKLLSRAECRGPQFRGKGVLCSHGHPRAVFSSRIWIVSQFPANEPFPKRAN